MKAGRQVGQHGDVRVMIRVLQHINMPCQTSSLPPLTVEGCPSLLFYLHDCVCGPLPVWRGCDALLGQH